MEADGGPLRLSLREAKQQRHDDKMVTVSPVNTRHHTVTKHYFLVRTVKICFLAMFNCTISVW